MQILQCCWFDGTPCYFECRTALTDENYFLPGVLTFQNGEDPKRRQKSLDSKESSSYSPQNNWARAYYNNESVRFVIRFGWECCTKLNHETRDCHFEPAINRSIYACQRTSRFQKKSGSTILLSHLSSRNWRRKYSLSLYTFSLRVKELRS